MYIQNKVGMMYVFCVYLLIDGNKSNMYLIN